MTTLIIIIFFCCCFIHLHFRLLALNIIYEDRKDLLYYDCLQNSTTSTFQENLALALGELASSDMNYNVTSTGSGIDKVYAMFQCRGDQQGCLRCFLAASSTLENYCPSSIGARIQYDLCYVRYGNQPFFTPDFDPVIGLCNTVKTSDALFLTTVASLMQNVTTRAPNNGGYAAQTAGGVYALAQCLGYLNESECSQCLTSYNYRLLCDSALGEQFHSVSCYYRYENYSFFDTPTPPPPPAGTTASPPNSGAVPALPRSTPPAPPHKREGSKIAIIITGAVVGVIFVTVALYLTFAVRRRKAKARQNLDAQNETWTQVLFQSKAKVFSFGELEVATRSFHPENKLGEGGFGPVYKVVIGFWRARLYCRNPSHSLRISCCLR